MRGNIKFIILLLIIGIVFFGTVYVVAKHKSKGQKDWVTKEASATRIEYVANIESEEEPMSDVENLALTMSELEDDIKEIKETEETETTNEFIELTDEDIEVTVEEMEVTQEEIDEQVEELDKVGLVSLGEFCLTAYCACTQCCGAYATGTTASGTTATANRTIAVDTSVIPFGTEVVINGNTYIAEDTGGAIDGNRIDIFFDSHQDALNFGVRYAEVFIKN